MDGCHLLLFIWATFLSGFISGFYGYAMGIVAPALGYLSIIYPDRSLIAGYGLLTRGNGIPRLRRELSWRTFLA